MARLKKEHGSVMDYVQNQRLKWTDFDAKGSAFEDPGWWFFSLFFSKKKGGLVTCRAFFLTRGCGDGGR